MPVDVVYVAGSGADPVADALDYCSRIGPAARALAETDPALRPAMIDRLAGLLADNVSDGQVRFPAAAWIWSARGGERA